VPRTPATTTNLLTGLGIDEYFTRTASSATSTFLRDALGSTVGLVGSAGTIATSYTYQPFGATAVSGTSNSNSYEFTGRENDGTGEYFYRARYYSPTNQRFAAQDPLDFGGGDTNLYSYVGNQPTEFKDPTGRQAEQGAEEFCLEFPQICDDGGALISNLLKGAAALGTAAAGALCHDEPTKEECDEEWREARARCVDLLLLPKRNRRIHEHRGLCARFCNRGLWR